MFDVLDSLNDKQREAVLQINGPVLILAGAGSGKTKALTVRIAYLMQKGVRPWNIMAITFTNKAAKEMRERIDAFDIPHAGDVWVSTFHSTCVRLLRMEIDKLGYDKNFAIYDADDQERLIKECIEILNLDKKQFPSKGIVNKIGRLKDELVTPAQFETDSWSNFYDKKVAAVYSLYQKRLKLSNALDFNDLIMKTVQLFNNFPDVLEKYQERFKYIMVDEYQDTNFAQYVLVNLLARKYRNLCVVGDDDQSIYGWRGADIRNILDFGKDFPDAVIIKLEQNYRSTKTILAAANDVIKNNLNRSNKTLWTENFEGANINLYNAFDEYDEANFIVSLIKGLVEQGSSFKEFAVLYRANAQSRVIEDELVRQSVPYRLFGGVRFYARKEIKDLLSYLCAINNPFDDIALKRIINVPKRGIGDTTVQKISEYAAGKEISFFQALGELDNIQNLSSRTKKLSSFYDMLSDFREDAGKISVDMLLDTILKKTGYVNELETENTLESKGRIENIKEFLNKGYEYSVNAQEPSLAGFLEEIALVADIDNYKDDENAVVLMTLHSSKGLEFPYVFMCGVEEDTFPGYRAVVSEDKSEMEEERRLCYVGITRARTELFITYANVRMIRGEITHCRPSRFIKEIPDKYISSIKKSQNKEKVKPSNMPAKPSNTKMPLMMPSLKREVKKPSVFYTLNSEIIKPTNNVKLNYKIGDRVKQQRYGTGVIMDINPAGADFEVSIDFTGTGVKKFMSNLVKLTVVKE